MDAQGVFPRGGRDEISLKIRTAAGTRREKKVKTSRS